MVVLIALGAVMALVAVVALVRARDALERLSALAALVLTILVFGGPAVLWPCGENDCGGLLTLYWIALGATAAAMAAIAIARRARRP